ncbi:hypothetical protein Q9Q94_13825 [Uliginosibacterium sp. 31-16]|uniref:hypothetical protein n=1 Tax=Uliginosibacterium sp. 31-16 TaxID=3068315 RepID=UPI00273D0072|nr:hypothetical protein [Uliginosibacterium sp. 31-16]MDP5240619.1 hypothetical protein [Uliginosibacterium sp. 31-16]
MDVHFFHSIQEFFKHGRRSLVQSIARVFDELIAASMPAILRAANSASAADKAAKAPAFPASGKTPAAMFAGNRQRK